MIQLVTRADDAGSCTSANRAITQTVEASVIKNVSFMAVGPHIEEATQLLAGRADICCGLHVTLNAEWHEVKWKPLTQTDTLTEVSGNFLPFPHDTKAFWGAAGVTAEVAAQVEAELEAQLQKLRDLGIQISYFDEHMGVSWIGLREIFSAFCQQHDLLDVYDVPGMPDIKMDADDLEQLKARLQQAPGRCVWVTHPGMDLPDMKRFYLSGETPGTVARERDAERRLLLDPCLPELLHQMEVSVCRYDELAK